MITDKEIDDSMNISNRNLGTYELLLICFGFLGVHRLYAKKYITGSMLAILGLLFTVNNWITIPYLTMASSIVIYLFFAFDLWSAMWGFVYDGTGKEITNDRKHDSLASFVFISIILLVVVLAYVFFDLLYIVQIIVYSIMWVVVLIKNIKEIVSK